MRTRLHVVAGLDVLDGSGNLRILDDNLAPLGFLDPQPLINQLAQHLRAQPGSMTSDDIGRPVEIANKRARLSMSASLMTSPLTTAAIRLAAGQRTALPWQRPVGGRLYPGAAANEAALVTTPSARRTLRRAGQGFWLGRRVGIGRTRQCSVALLIFIARDNRIGQSS